MSRISPETWQHLERDRPAGDALTVRLALPDVTSRLQAALDADNSRHLIIRLNDHEFELQDLRSRGLSVETREMSLGAETPARYLDIVCRDAAGHPAFDIIGGELGVALAEGRHSPERIVTQVLSKWRRFWGQLPRQILSREEQIGLFAELWFLSAWLAPYSSPADAVRRWRGPYGARHDFEWTGKSIEIKATSITRGRVHKIHGIDQLSPPETGELFLFSLRVREEAGASNTLNVAVEQVRRLLGSDHEQLEVFETSLIRAGYNPAHVAEYEILKLRVVDEYLFAVRDNFPRLTREHLNAPLPQGVENVGYDIHLDGFQDLSVSEQDDLREVLHR